GWSTQSDRPDQGVGRAIAAHSAQPGRGDRPTRRRTHPRTSPGSLRTRIALARLQRSRRLPRLQPPQALQTDRRKGDSLPQKAGRPTPPLPPRRARRLAGKPLSARKLALVNRAMVASEATANRRRPAAV